MGVDARAVEDKAGVTDAEADAEAEADADAEAGAGVLLLEYEIDPEAGLLCSAASGSSALKSTGSILPITKAAMVTS